ncbi:PAS domain-containing sensor histidine kinase, partial [bacterium]|nr:PAS domain-containing sensor histidine kinase [bacterium]
ESMFRSLSDSALTGIIRFNKNGEIVYANDTLAKIFGFETNIEFKKSNFIEFFDDPQGIKRDISSSKTGSSMLNKQFKIKNRMGDYRDILVSAGVYEETISANVLDITNLIQLNKEVQQLNHAIRQMADTVFITDDKGIIEYVNPAFEMKTGFSYGDSVGKHIKTIIRELSTDSDPSFIWETLLDGNPHEFEYQTRLNNLEIIAELISISPISNSEGKTIQYIGSGKDITDIKKARQEIIDLNSNLEKRVIQRTSELEKARKEIEAFSYSVSHDLRAPLRNMHGYSSILLDEYAKSLDSAALTYLLHIQEASVKMDNLIQDLLKLSHISKSDCVRRKVDLADFAKGIIQNLRNEEPNRNVTIEIPESLFVWADADLISIAMDNLIRNAWKFTKRKSDAKIEIGSYFDEEEQV